MTRVQKNPEIDPHKYDAWLFDLDGVITDTASVHSNAWKKMFDDYLKQVADRDNVPFKAFEIDPDYFKHVDGRPRYDGVDTFLRSRGLEIAWGDPEDGPDKETVCGLGNRKNTMFNDVLKEQGAVVFQTSVDLVRKIRAEGKPVAVVTSSKNCDTVLEVAGLTDLFDNKVDGNVAAEHNLKGKPDPHTYEVAAVFLGTPAERCVVIEDAISGVQAGKAGGFGLVIGVARHDEPAALLENGADIVVGDLGELEY